MSPTTTGSTMHTATTSPARSSTRPSVTNRRLPGKRVNRNSNGKPEAQSTTDLHCTPDHTRLRSAPHSFFSPSKFCPSSSSSSENPNPNPTTGECLPPCTRSQSTVLLSRESSGSSRHRIRHRGSIEAPRQDSELKSEDSDLGIFEDEPRTSHRHHQLSSPSPRSRGRPRKIFKQELNPDSSSPEAGSLVIVTNGRQMFSPLTVQTANRDTSSSDSPPNLGRNRLSGNSRLKPSAANTSGTARQNFTTRNSAKIETRSKQQRNFHSAALSNGRMLNGNFGGGSKAHRKFSVHSPPIRSPSSPEFLSDSTILASPTSGSDSKIHRKKTQRLKEKPKISDSEEDEEDESVSEEEDDEEEDEEEAEESEDDSPVVTRTRSHGSSIRPEQRSSESSTEESSDFHSPKSQRLTGRKSHQSEVSTLDTPTRKRPAQSTVISNGTHSKLSRQSSLRNGARKRLDSATELEDTEPESTTTTSNTPHQLRRLNGGVHARNPLGSKSLSTPLPGSHQTHHHYHHRRQSVTSLEEECYSSSVESEHPRNRKRQKKAPSSTTSGISSGGSRKDEDEEEDEEGNDDEQNDDSEPEVKKNRKSKRVKLVRSGVRRRPPTDANNNFEPIEESEDSGSEQPKPTQRGFKALMMHPQHLKRHSTSVEPKPATTASNRSTRHSTAKAPSTKLPEKHGLETLVSPRKLNPEQEESIREFEKFQAKLDKVRRAQRHHYKPTETPYDVKLTSMIDLTDSTKDFFYSVAFNELFTPTGSDPKPSEAEEEEEVEEFAAVGNEGAGIFRTTASGEIRPHYWLRTPNDIMYTCAWSYDTLTATTSAAADLKDPLLITGGEHGAIYVVNTVTGAVQSLNATQAGPVNDLRVDQKKPQLIFSAHADGAIRLWNTRSTHLVAVFFGWNGHKEQAITLDVHPVHQYVISAGMDNAILIWDYGIECLVEPIRRSDFPVYRGQRSLLRTKEVHLPVWQSHTVHSHYVDTVRWWHDYVLTRSVDTTMLLWKPTDVSLRGGGLRSVCGRFVARDDTNAKLRDPPRNWVPLIRFPTSDTDQYWMRFALSRDMTDLAIGDTEGRLWLYKINRYTWHEMRYHRVNTCGWKAANAIVRQVAFGGGVGDRRSMVTVQDGRIIARYSVERIQPTEGPLAECAQAEVREQQKQIHQMEAKLRHHLRRLLDIGGNDGNAGNETGNETGHTPNLACDSMLYQLTKKAGEKCGTSGRIRRNSSLVWSPIPNTGGGHFGGDGSDGDSAVVVGADGTANGTAGTALLTESFRKISVVDTVATTTGGAPSTTNGTNATGASSGKQPLLNKDGRPVTMPILEHKAATEGVPANGERSISRQKNGRTVISSDNA